MQRTTEIREIISGAYVQSGGRQSLLVKRSMLRWLLLSSFILLFTVLVIFLTLGIVEFFGIHQHLVLGFHPTS